jgi:glutamine amidotransferase
VKAKADKIILPGVGAFGDAAAKLRENGLDKLIIERAKAGVPLMGICLGMQMLFDESHEFGCHKGLGLIPGKVVSMDGVIAPELKIPQMGWNALHFPNAELKASSPVFCDIDEGEFVYFVHSYYASECDADVVAVCDCGVPITAAVVRGNVMGCQFHPEKSSKAGLKILKNFCEGDFGGAR